MKIAVIYGGTSSERDVSLSTGKGVINALKSKGHQVTPIDFHPERIHDLLDLDADLAFIGLHGKYGEDGKIQALLEMLSIPYVGSGVMASALAMDKDRSKVMFDHAGITTPKGKVIVDLDLPLQTSPLGYPVVIKPNSEGSTFGLTIAEDDQTFVKGINEAFKFDDRVLLEEYIDGKEITVAVIGDGKDAEALPVVEIVPKNKIYDYESKYTPGMSDHFVPARIPEEAATKAKEWSVLAHNVLGCETYSRVDFILPTNGEEPVILEVNTLPGMTPTSLFPDAARSVGMSYENMIETLISRSLKTWRTGV